MPTSLLISTLATDVEGNSSNNKKQGDNKGECKLTFLMWLEDICITFANDYP